MSLFIKPCQLSPSQATGAAVPIAFVSVCILVCKFMIVFAVSFLSGVWGHCKSREENTPLRIKQFLERCALPRSCHKGINLQSRQTRKKFSAIRNPLDCNFQRSSLVALLLNSGCPATIFATVRTIIVNSLNKKSIWPLSHILRKRQKAASPFFANGNASSAVIRELLESRVVAALLHLCPNFIQGAGSFIHKCNISHVTRLVNEVPRVI